jgi:hypothetical protein
MTEALMSLVTSAFMLMWPFYWPLVAALGLRVVLDVFVRGIVPPGRATRRSILLAVAVGLLGGAAIVCALVPGVFAYSFSRVFIPGRPASSLVMELLSEGGVARVGLLVLVTAVGLLLFGAGVGVLLWLGFGKDAPHMALRQWVSESAVLWAVGFVLSIVEALVIAVVMRGANPTFLLGLGGFVTGLAAGKWVRNISWVFEGEPEEAATAQVAAGMTPPVEWRS